LEQRKNKTFKKSVVNVIKKIEVYRGSLGELVNGDFSEEMSFWLQYKCIGSHPCIH
jgi:hypothetical protein